MLLSGEMLVFLQKLKCRAYCVCWGCGIVIVRMDVLNLYSAEIVLYKSWRPEGYFQFEIIINILVSAPFKYICHESANYNLFSYNLFNYFSAGIDFRHQNLTSIDVYRRSKIGPRAERVISRLLLIFSIFIIK